MRIDWRSWKSRVSWKVSFAFLGAIFVAVLLIAQIYRSGWCNDESAHIPAGLYHLETGRMDAYRVNPPLFRMLAAVPLLVDHPKIDWFSMTAPQARSEYVYADHWIRDNLAQVPRQLWLARSVMTLSKFSWLFLFVLFPCLTLIHDLLSSPEIRGDRFAVAKSIAQRWDLAWRRIGKLSIALFCTVVIINLVYGFEGTGRRLGDFEFLSTSLGGTHESRFETGNRYRGTLLGAIPMPLPCEMLQGIDYLKWEFEEGKKCYLLGEWKFRGWWYYYLVAMAVKFPIGYFVQIGIGSVSMIARYVCKRSIRGEWLLPLVAGLFLAQVSSQTGFTHHLRYVLPAFGFLYMMAARTLIALPRLLATVTIIASLFGTVLYHATHIGQAHAHFNWLAGGPENGWRHLSLSNVDWGQSTFRMADWARSHPEKRPLTILFVSPLGGPSQLVADLNVATSVRWENRDGDGTARTPTPGWYLLSSEQLTHKENLYFRDAKPLSWPFADTALFYVLQD